MLHHLSIRATEVSPVLVVMVGTRACAIPLHHVAETLRPLPIQSVAGMPNFVRGVSVIRGTPTPVVVQIFDPLFCHCTHALLVKHPLNWL
jgi:chemotaxis signal transduction protein